MGPGPIVRIYPLSIIYYIIENVLYSPGAQLISVLGPRPYKFHIQTTIYKTLLQPIWTNCHQLGGKHLSIKNSKVSKIQTFQNIIFTFLTIHSRNGSKNKIRILNEAKFLHKRFHNKLLFHNSIIL